MIPSGFKVGIMEIASIMRKPQVSPRRRQRPFKILSRDRTLLGPVLERAREPTTPEQTSNPLLAYELKCFVLEFFSYLSIHAG